MACIDDERQMGYENRNGQGEQVTMSILDCTAVELSEKIKAGTCTAMEAMEAVFERIGEKEEEHHCYITADRKSALKRAAAVQAKIEKGELTGALAGVPVAVKDNLCTKGVLTSCASKILSNFVPTYSATAVENLEKAGMVMIGKTNMDEFAMGSTTETSYYGVTKNPANPAHVPGGSSGGSAAAVALSECFMALGSDTGGSIRQPASYCGVVGLKPTYGMVSRYGLVAYASSLDQIGPLAKNVTDAAQLLQAVASYDEKDSTSAPEAERDFPEALKEDVKGMRIGIPTPGTRNPPSGSWPGRGALSSGTTCPSCAGTCGPRFRRSGPGCGPCPPFWRRNTWFSSTEASPPWNGWRSWTAGSA